MYSGEKWHITYSMAGGVAVALEAAPSSRTAVKPRKAAVGATAHSLKKGERDIK